MSQLTYADMENMLINRSRMMMVRDGSGRGQLVIDINIKACEADKFVYDLKHLDANYRKELEERAQLAALKEKYEGTL